MTIQNTISVANIEKPVPLYKQIKNIILSIIRDRKLQKGEILPAEPVLCNMLEVSSITVRRALRELGQEGWISRKPGIGTIVTDKVNARPRILISFRWKVDETAYYAQSLINAFNSIENKECDLQIISGSSDYESQYLEYKADGMIIVAPKMNQYTTLKTMKESGRHFIVLGASSPKWDLNFVDCDHSKAAFIAVEYFIKQGHKNIGLLNGPVENYDCQNILNGYFAALKENKYSIEHTLVKHIESTPIVKDHLSVVQEWLSIRMKEKKKPTALLCAGHLLSTDVYTCSNNDILKIPDDISVITLDETPVNMALSPPLTAIRQPLKEMAVEALNSLSALKKDDQYHVAKRLNPELIVRKSVKEI